MLRKKTMLVMLAGLLVIGALVGTSLTAQAQSETPLATDTPPEVTETPEVPEGTLINVHHGPNWNADINNEYLAGVLGITSEELSTAFSTAYTDAINKALELGLINETRANLALTRNKMGRFGIMGLVANGRWAQVGFDTLLAEALGISVEDLDAAREGTKQAKLDEAVANGEMTQEEADLEAGIAALQNSAEFSQLDKSNYQTVITNAVTAGTLTQAQADAILAEINSSHGNSFFAKFHSNGSNNGKGFGRGNGKK